MSELTLSDFAVQLETLDPQLPLAIAVSGGADSVALMCLVCQWADKKGELSKITALTINHNLRIEAQVEAARVAGWAQELGISQQILTWKNPVKEGNVQALARDARYRLLTDWCVENGCCDLLTAHHLDDQAETFLLRLIRGSGVDGLAAMAPVRMLSFPNGNVRLLRPLLKYHKSELKVYLSDCDRTWIDDPSNDDERFSRAKVRKLKETFDELGLGTKRLVETAARMSQARDALEDAAERLIEKVTRTSPIGFLSFDAVPLLSAPRDIGLRALSRLLIYSGGAVYPPRYERLNRLYDELAKGEIGQGRTLHGCRVMHVGNLVDGVESGHYLVAREARDLEQVVEVLSKGMEQVVWDRRFCVTFEGDLEDLLRSFEVRMLGKEGAIQLRKTLVENNQGSKLPTFMLETLPGLWVGSELVALPTNVVEDNIGSHEWVREVPKISLNIEAIPMKIGKVSPFGHEGA